MTAPTQAIPQPLAGPVAVDLNSGYTILYGVPSSGGILSVILRQLRATIPSGAGSQTLSYGIVRNGGSTNPPAGAWTLLDSMPVGSQDPLTDDVTQVLLPGDKVVAFVQGATLAEVTITLSGAILK